MNRFAFSIVALMIGTVVVSSGQPATAGKYHSKSSITPTVSERFRNAKAYWAPAFSFTRDSGYFDEALAPPAGR